ncbi:hypothetical protein SAMN05892883_0014 [Jatrophihabitans sp. GAS493]|uniref:glycosyltransferase family 2 protein n=1 Tax=Jatrophihabitans sp. GAS493 TaxID=1907575 RepID=UPI000BBFC75B|nr:glycosyltransferase family 2 protein [Jatrophihabitans sp. GAS493]SOD70283.1 hypothetical protein SAMN05892883_0014 [Jatrophihabitans sp. GAS493]
MSDAEVSIVIVLYNCQEWIRRCLDSIPAALADRTAEIVVVDNASADSSADIVAAEYPEVMLLRNTSNLGFAGAVNQGVAASSAPWVLLLNPDTEAQPEAFARLLTFAESMPGRGIYGGRTLRSDLSVEPSSCWALPTIWSSATFALGLSTVFARSRLFDPESMGSWQRDSVREVGMVTGCLLLTPRTVWDELHGLDERYFVYGEDADFAARARDRGYRPTITPDAAVIHEIGISSADGGSKTTLLLAGKITYARTHLPGPFAVYLLRVGVALRALGARITGRGTKWRVAWSRRESWWDGFPEQRR